MTSIIAENQTVSRGTYGTAVRITANIPEDFVAANIALIDRAYSYGEPVWMIADELRLRYQHRPQATKSPAELAKRFVRITR